MTDQLGRIFDALDDVFEAAERRMLASIKPRNQSPSHTDIESLNCSRGKKDFLRRQQHLPQRVEIWRYTHNTLTVCCTDGSAFNTADSMFAGPHEGHWDSNAMRFVPEFVLVPDWLLACSGSSPTQFSDGSPVEMYAGQEPHEDESWAS